MRQSKLISQQFSKSQNLEIKGTIAFLVENVSSTEDLFFGFEQGLENIKVEPLTNRPFRANADFVFNCELWVKTNGNFLIIKEIEILTESI